MSNVKINISFQDDLLDEVDRAAKRESRTRSEWIREAVRVYMVRQKRRDSVFALGDKVSKRKNLTEAGVAAAIEDVRRRKKASQ